MHQSSQSLKKGHSIF